MLQRQKRRYHRLSTEKEHDTYRSRRKRRAPAICSKCGALFLNGRWTWKTAPQVVAKTTCPACRRIVDNCPAGLIDLEGDFLNIHRTEILHLMLRVGRREQAAHPLERIMAINTEGCHISVTTTGVHIANRIAKAISRSYHGDLKVQFPEAETCVRVHWSRMN